MGQETRDGEFADLLFSEPLESVTERELRVQYGPAMEKARLLLHRALARQRAADLVVSCVREAGNAALRVVDRVGDVVANFVNAALPAPAYVPAYAARGIGGGGAANAGCGSAGRIEAAKKGDGAELKVVIDGSSGRCDVRIRLEDLAAGATLSPLDLYIEDREDGKVLLEKTSYASGEAVLRGVEPGEYWIEAECGDKSAEMALKVEGAGR